MRIAVLSDVHGNLTAFEAVLADIDTRGVDRIINLGDIVGKGPRGSQCCALTRDRCDVMVRGNWDVFMLGDPSEFSPAMQWWYHELAPNNVEWFGTLPFAHDFTLAGTRIRAYHASSDSVFHRIYPGVEGEEWSQLFANTPETGDGPVPDIVIYGDIHYAWERTIGTQTLINCSSVGNPLDVPVAGYLMLDDESGVLRRELIRVPYDIEAELAVARAMDMPQYDWWEHELRTAKYARR